MSCHPVPYNVHIELFIIKNSINFSSHEITIVYFINKQCLLLILPQ